LSYYNEINFFKFFKFLYICINKYSSKIDGFIINLTKIISFIEQNKEKMFQKTKVKQIEN